VPDDRRAFWLGLAGLLPLLVWWAGWFPGVLTSDSIDQLGQGARFSFTDFHPALHSLYLWVLSLPFSGPAGVSLFQVLALSLLLALTALRLTHLGVPQWPAVGAAWLVALLPAVGPTTISLWKDVPYSLALLWAFIELLHLARAGSPFWEERGSVLRLGIALGLAFLFRHNGLLTVLPLLAVLLAVFRQQWRKVGLTVLIVALMVGFVQLVLYRAIPVDRSKPASAELFIPDVASAMTHEPENFAYDELLYLSTIAPNDVWTTRYNCTQSGPLLFAPEFDTGVIRQDPDRFQALALRTMLRDPDSVLQHRLCVTSYLFVPWQPQSTSMQVPPAGIPANDLGIERSPLSWKLFLGTKAVYDWSLRPEVSWLAWRPALPLWLALVTYLGVAIRPPLRPLFWPGALLVIQLTNTALTSTGHEFRFAFPIYLMSWLSLPLAWLALRPQEGGGLWQTP
jgi:hypothetical protein